MAKRKTAAYNNNVTRQLQGAASLVAVAWHFVPLCADTTGVLAKDFRDTIHKCGQRVNIAYRGHVVGIWWQMLSVAIQKEHHRVLLTKAAASSGQPPSPISQIESDLSSLALLAPGLL